MINPQEQRIQKIVNLLEATNLFSSNELETAEDYLTAQEGQEAGYQAQVEQLSLRNLAALPNSMAANFIQLFSELSNKGRNEEARKLADILFAAGRSSAFALFPFYGYSHENNILADPVRKIAIMAAKYASNEWQISRYSVESLIKLADNKIEKIRSAIDYQYETPQGKLFLCAVYFYMKYPGVRFQTRKTDEKSGILAGIAKAFEQRKGGAQDIVEMEPANTQLMQQYEDIIINSIPNLFGKRLAEPALRVIVDAVRKNTMDEGVLSVARSGGPTARYLLRLLGGTAFINFALSPRLRNIVSLCIAVSTAETLNVMDNLDIRGDLRSRGGSFDEIFGIPPKEYIKWAAEKKNREILKAQFVKNREDFIEYMRGSEFEVYNLMSSIVKELDPALYQQDKGKETYRQQGKVVEEFLKTVDSSVQSQVGSYLRCETEIDTLYRCENELISKGSRWGGRHWNILKSYENGYGYDSLTARCEVLLMMSRCFNSYSYLVSGGTVAEKDVKRLFEMVDREKLALRNQLDGYGDMWESFYSDKNKREFCDASKKVFRKYLAERTEEMIAAFQNAGSTGRSFGVSILGENPEKYKDAILSFTQDSSKQVKEELLRVLYGRKDWEEDIQKLLASKKAADRETAVRVLAKWDSEKYASVLTGALEKEKNGKVRTLLETALKIEGGEKAGGTAITRDDMVKELHKGGKKRSLAWAYETPFSKVHKKDGQEAGEEYLQAVFLCYSSMSPCGVNPTAATLAADLNEQEFAVYANELFDKWMEQGAESKKRWVLYAASIHGGAEIVKKLQHQIQEWPQAARGAIASEAVQALALNPLPQALLIVDGISRKFKFKQVKAAAAKALEFAASQLGITTEELADRIVPNLGFDENMERIFDYGERKFTVTITTALEIEVFDESGKKLKNLPAPGKRDDEVKAAAAYEEFKQMKKQMKTTVSSQKMRLEMALSTGREWSVEAWKNLFVKNPVMHQFAIGLIWGIYEEHKLISCFRYMEDGSFNTEDEEEFELPEGDSQAIGEGQAIGRDQVIGRGQSIGLVHPIELSSDSLKTWKEQLEDYEITQPIEQLDRPVYYRTEEEGDQKSLERFGGYIVNDLSLGGKLMAAGWYRGSVQDAGGFYTYYREDPELCLGVELHFSGSFVGGENQDVTVYEARFYNAGGSVVDKDGKTVTAGIRRGSYVYDETNDSNSYCLKEVPERYFSEIVLQLTRALASSKEKNENWKKNR